MSSPKSNMLTRFKNKFLTKNRKYEVTNGSQDGQCEVHMNKYERAKSATLGSNASNRSSTESPKHQHAGIIWHNNTYDLLPFQLDTISPKASVRSLPCRRIGGEELPPLPLKKKDSLDDKKKLCDSNDMLIEECKTPSPSDTYVTPIAKSLGESKDTNSKKVDEDTNDERPGDIEVKFPCPVHDLQHNSRNGTSDELDGMKLDEEDREYPHTWLRSARIKSPNASVSTPSPSDSESKTTDTSLVSDSTNAEKKPDLKKREKPAVKPPMLRPLRKKKPPPAPSGEAKFMDRENAPLPPPPPVDMTNSTEVGLESSEVGYTSLDELQAQLQLTSLPAPPVEEPLIDDDTPFPPPPPPLIEALNSRTLEVEEGEVTKQTIVRPRYKDGLLSYDGCSDISDMEMLSVNRENVRTKRDISDYNQGIDRNISHESGYETSGIDHSSSSEQIRDDVFPDPVKDLISENLDYGDEEERHRRKGPIYRDTTEVKLLSPKAVRDLYAYVPKANVPRSYSHQSDTSTDNYPESPENTGTSSSVSSPDNDGDGDTLKMSTEMLLPLSIAGPDSEILDDDDDEEDYLPPIPSRNYQTDDDIEDNVEAGDDMTSSVHSDVSTDSTEVSHVSEPVHMSLDEVRKQAKSLGVPLAIQQSQPCISAKTTTLLDMSSSEPMSPTSKHNTFPSDRASTVPKKHSTKKKAKLRIPNIFARGKSSPEHIHRCEIHGNTDGTIQRRSLPMPPSSDDDKTPVGSPAHHQVTMCQVHGAVMSSPPSSPYRSGTYGRHNRSASDRRSDSPHRGQHIAMIAGEAGNGMMISISRISEGGLRVGF